jgi:D-tyrosyl-tRNA(Tyr) deacylase
MRVVIQRVSSARVRINNLVSAEIGRGLLVLVGIARTDTRSDADYLIAKIAGLRVFPDDQDRMNRSVSEVGGALLIVSNFTVYGDCRKGRRPGFDLAAPPPEAKVLYDYFVEKAKETGVEVRTGVFQAQMMIELQNDGPVTLICDSK